MRHELFEGRISRLESFQLENREEPQYRRDFSFLKQHIYKLRDALNIPSQVGTFQRTVATSINTLCILLKDLRFLCRYTNMVVLLG